MLFGVVHSADVTGFVLFVDFLGGHEELTFSTVMDFKGRRSWNMLRHFTPDVELVNNVYINTYYVFFS
jgi:hypothetical protein